MQTSSQRNQSTNLSEPTWRTWGKSSKSHGSRTNSTNPNYSVSKACLNGYTRVLAKDLTERPCGHKISVNAYCPCMTATEMATGYWDTRDPPVPDNVRAFYHSPSVGAEGATWLALLPAKDLPTGAFVAQKKVADFWVDHHIPFLSLVSYQALPIWTVHFHHLHLLCNVQSYCQRSGHDSETHCP